MAFISNIKFSATKTAGVQHSWKVTVKYNANFTPYELSTGNFRFKDSFAVWEDDSWPNSDDRVTGEVGGSVFNPTASPTVRTLTYTLTNSERAIADEIFGEELYAVVKLTNIDLNVPYTKKSATLHIDL